MVAEADTPAGGENPTSVWERLLAVCDVTSYRPRLREGLVWKELTTTHGENYLIIQNPEAATYLRLPPEDFHIFQLMDGSHTVQQLVVEYMLRFRRFALQHLLQLVEDLRYNEFLSDKPYSTYPLVRRLARPRSIGSVLDRTLNLYLNREFPIKGVDALVENLYRGGAWVLLTAPGLVLLSAIVLSGVPLLIWDLHTAHISLTDRSLLAQYALLGYISLLAIAIIHELGHAFAVKSYGRAVRRSGVGLFYGSPCLYVDTQDMWMAPRSARIAASWAGPYSGFILAGLAGLALAFLPHGGWVLFVRAFGITALVENAFQLNPFIQYDGYYILMDWLDIYNLRRRALVFIRHDLWRKIWRREHFNREERIFAVFGILAAVYTVYMIFFVVMFGWDHARDAIQNAVRVPNLQSLLLAVLLAMIMIPFLIGVTARLLGLVQSLRSAAGRATGAARDRWYHERVALLSQVPSLAKLGEEPVRALAPHLREKRLRGGAAIVRQGERGDRFYLIVDGTAEVFVENEQGAKAVAELGPMDYFGERALIEDAPRAATVRAKTKLRLLSLGADDFRRSVAPFVAEDAALRARLDELAELERFPLLEPLGPRDREILLAHLRPRTFAAGESIIHQGDRGDDFYLIRSGEVEIVRSDDVGRENRVQTLGPGEFFGEIALLLDSSRTATVRALLDCTVWVLSGRDFGDLLRQYFKLDDQMLPVVSQRLLEDQLMILEPEDFGRVLVAGDQAPDLDLTSGWGVNVRLSDFRGGRIVVWFSAASTAAHSLQYLAALNAALPAFEERNVRLLLIDPHRIAPVRKEDRPAGRDVPVLHDPEKSGYRCYGMYNSIGVRAAEPDLAWQAAFGELSAEPGKGRTIATTREGVAVIDAAGSIERIYRREAEKDLPSPVQLLDGGRG